MGLFKNIVFKFFVCVASVGLESSIAAGPTGDSSPIRYVKAVYSLPVSFDPVQMNDTASLVFSELVYEGLLRLNKDYGFEGALAESWTTSADGRKLTFRLRRNAKFHDGSPVTSNDVVSSLQRAVGPDSKVFSYYDSISGAKAYHRRKTKTVSGLVALDLATVEIHLERPFPPILYVLAGATAKVLPKSANGKPDFFTHPIGSGPFRFGRVDKLGTLKQVVLSRFDEYPRLDSNIDELVLLETNEMEARKLAGSGQVHDLANWPLTGTEEVFGNGQHVSSIIAHTWIIGMNSRIPPFDNVEVRRAFKQSFGSEDFRAKFYPDAKLALGYIPPGFPGSRTQPIPAGPGAMRAPRAQITIAIPEVLAKADEIAGHIHTSFGKRGWNVSVRKLSWTEMMKGYQDKSLQAFLVSMNVDYPDSEFLLRNFESKNPDNFSGICDSELDRLLDRSRSTVDRIQRERIYQAAANRLEELSPTINLFHPRAHIWLHECVRGFEPNLLADAYIDYRRVKLDQKCLAKAARK